MPTFCQTYFQAKKNTKRESSFSGISPNIFGIVGVARNKNRNTKKHASTSSKIFSEKKHKKKNTAVNHEIFLQALLERQDGERRRWREETEMRTLDMEHQVWIVIMMMNIIFILIKWWCLYFWENQCTKKQYSFEFSSSLKLRKERWSWQSWKQNGQGISCLVFYF